MDVQKQLEKSQKYLNDGNIKEAIKILEDLDWKGNKKSTLILGTLYYKGYFGVKIDYAKALSYLKESSKEHNDPTAQLWLSNMYLEGHGVKKSVAEGYFWAYKSVQNGGGEHGDNSLRLLEALEKDLNQEQLKKVNEYVQARIKEEEIDNKILDIFLGKNK